MSDEVLSVKNAPLCPPGWTLLRTGWRYTLDTGGCVWQRWCVLPHEQKDGSNHLVDYWSGERSDEDQTLATTHGESLKVVWAVALLWPYLIGTHFIIRIDHEALW